MRRAMLIDTLQHQAVLCSHLRRAMLTRVLQDWCSHLRNWCSHQRRAKLTRVLQDWCDRSFSMLKDIREEQSLITKALPTFNKERGQFYGERQFGLNGCGRTTETQRERMILIRLRCKPLQGSKWSLKYSVGILDGSKVTHDAFTDATPSITNVYILFYRLPYKSDGLQSIKPFEKGKKNAKRQRKSHSQRLLRKRS